MIICWLRISVIDKNETITVKIVNEIGAPMQTKQMKSPQLFE